MDKEYFELLSELRNDLISVGEIIDLEKISINVDRYIEMFFLKKFNSEINFKGIVIYNNLMKETAKTFSENDKIIYEYVKKYNNLKNLYEKIKNPCKIILFDNKNIKIENIGEIEIFPLANYDTAKSEPKIYYSKEIFLDSNIIGKFTVLDKMNLKDKDSFISLFQNMEYAWNIFPYIWENAGKKKLKLQEDKDIIIQTLKNYENFTRKYSTNIEKDSIDNEVNKYWSIIEEINGSKEHLLLYNMIYAMILYSFYIKIIKIANKYAKKKYIQELIDFIEKIGVYLENETLLCMEYLKDNNELCPKFFKIDDLTKDALEKIRNRAWDLFHLRFIEVDFFRNEDIKFPHIATDDKGFKIVIEFNPIKQIIIENGIAIPIHEKNILTENSNYAKVIEKLKNKYRFEKIMKSSYDEKILKIEQVIEDIENKIKNEISKL